MGTERYKHWFRVLTGSDYWTSSPAEEPGYRPDALDFYYRDYTPKADWRGWCDKDGVPLVREEGRGTFYHPIIIAQKALGHWNLLARGPDPGGRHEAAFLGLARWFRDNQEEPGGWRVASMMKARYVAPYSAMAQGQVASVLVRAHRVSGDGAFLAGARRALEFMLRPVEDGGTARRVDAGLVLEEYTTRALGAVLNGWVNALFGLHDYRLADREGALDGVLDESVRTLDALLPRYDMGYWSYYDLAGTVSSPYYHHVHIDQLAALVKTFPDYADDFTAMRRRFAVYQTSPVNRARALARKAYQKVRERDATTLVHR